MVTTSVKNESIYTAVIGQICLIGFTCQRTWVTSHDHMVLYLPEFTVCYHDSNMVVQHCCSVLKVRKMILA